MIKLIQMYTSLNSHEYPLVNVYVTMENHHVQWENSLQMAMFNSFLYVYQLVYLSYSGQFQSYTHYIPSLSVFFHIIYHHIPIKKNSIINHNVIGYLIVMNICSRHVHVNVMFHYIIYIYISESLYISIIDLSISAL